MSASPPPPNAIVIGAQKSATRWLRANLGKHPDVFAADRELSFFNHEARFRRLGLTWYRRQFVGWNGQAVLLEGTPGYMVPRHDPAEVARRIDEALQGVKLFAILRNPLDRAQSALVHHIRYDRVRPGTRLRDYVRDVPPESDWLGVVSCGWYARCLRPFAERFGGRLLVLFHDDVADRPEAVYHAALSHLDVDPSFMPEDLHEVLFAREEGSADEQLTDEERRELWPLFEEDVRALESLVDRDLSAWAPARSVEPTGSERTPSPSGSVARPSDPTSSPWR